MTRKLYLLLGLLCGVVLFSACGNTGKGPGETSAASLEETKQTEAKYTSQAVETETIMQESSSETPTKEPFEIGDFILTSKNYCDEYEFTFVLPYFVSTSDTLASLNQQIEDDFKAICEDAAAKIKKDEGPLEYYSVDWYSVEYFNQLALYVYAARGEEEEPKVYLYDRDKDKIMTKEDFLLLAGFEEKEFLKEARKMALDYYMSMPKGEQSCYPDLTDARTLKKYVSMENQMYVNGDMECVVLFLELGEEGGPGFRYHTLYVPLNGVG